MPVVSGPSEDESGRGSSAADRAEILARWLERCFQADNPQMRPQDWLVMARSAVRLMNEAT